MRAGWMYSHTSCVRSKCPLFTIWAHIQKQVFFIIYLFIYTIPWSRSWPGTQGRTGPFRWPLLYSHRVGGPGELALGKGPMFLHTTHTFLLFFTILLHKYTSMDTVIWFYLWLKFIEMDSYRIFFWQRMGEKRGRGGEVGYFNQTNASEKQSCCTQL